MKSTKNPGHTHFSAGNQAESVGGRQARRSAEKQAEFVGGRQASSSAGNQASASAGGKTNFLTDRQVLSQPVDMRLVPPALAAWLTCLIGANIPLWANALLLCVYLSAGAAWFLATYGGLSGGKHGALLAKRPGALLGLALVCALIAGGACMAHRWAVEKQPLNRWAFMGYTDVKLWGTVDATPRLLQENLVHDSQGKQVKQQTKAQAKPQAKPQAKKYVVTVSVTDFRLPRGGSVARASGTVRIIGTGWGDVRLGDKIRVVADLQPCSLSYVACAVNTHYPAVIDTSVASINPKRGVLKLIDSAVGPQYPASRNLVPAMLAGERASLGPHIEASFRGVSLTHIAVVSGMHVAVIMGIVWALTLWLPTALRVATAGVALVAFVGVVGAQPSVIRSALMGALVLVAHGLGRPTQAVSALSFAVIVMCVATPLATLTYGFALSVAATAAIICRAHLWEKRLNLFLPRFLAASISVPMVAQVWCIPILLMFTNSISLYAIPVNMCVAPAVSALLPAAIVGIVAYTCSYFYPAALVYHVAMWVCEACSAWIITVADTANSLPFNTIPWIEGPVGALLFTIVTVCMLAVFVIYEPDIYLYKRFQQWRQSRHIARAR